MWWWILDKHAIKELDFSFIWILIELYIPNGEYLCGSYRITQLQIDTFFWSHVRFDEPDLTDLFCFLSRCLYIRAFVGEICEYDENGWDRRKSHRANKVIGINERRVGLYVWFCLSLGGLEKDSVNMSFGKLPRHNSRSYTVNKAHFYAPLFYSHIFKPPALVFVSKC